MAVVHGTLFRSLCGLHHQYRNISTSSSAVCEFLINHHITSNNNNNKYMSTKSGESPVEPPPPELSGKNAYDLLGVSDTCSFAEIKASFRKLAKQTHPDLSQSPLNSHRFLQILAAYQILSDTEKRAHYDRYLFTQKVVVQQRSRQGSSMYTYESYETTEKQMEVVDWLKWYRYAINDIVSERRMVDGTSYFEVLENDFYSAIHAAYYGPVIQSMDFLPDCFEADVRSVPGTPEILHLVSGRDLFGKVCIAKKFLELSHACNKQLPSPQSLSLEVSYTDHDSGTHTCDAYKDLELHVAGKIVAVANRVRAKGDTTSVSNEECEDRIDVYLNLHEDDIFSGSESNKNPEEDVVASKVFLGTIIGLGTSGDEGSCMVHDSCGVKTHVVMIHRTLLVKHMHWYQLGDKASLCECRCTRARLPPSKYWLFEPRSGLHDIGGWYIETYGRDNKGKNVPSQRYWDGVDVTNPSERRVHPAVYLLALAYRTLDIEDAKRKKHKIRDLVGGTLAEAYNWCKKLV
uniref:chaperone protein DnaJ n=1 Tax=Erigeron canadensis TaxID=72917 RepID=UPI001CB9C871|nr:chaperone protein DnaJ [Erigeron canadensis]